MKKKRRERGTSKRRENTNLSWFKFSGRPPRAKVCARVCACVFFFLSLCVRAREREKRDTVATATVSLCWWQLWKRWKRGRGEGWRKSFNTGAWTKLSIRPRSALANSRRFSLSWGRAGPVRRAGNVKVRRSHTQLNASSRCSHQQHMNETGFRFFSFFFPQPVWTEDCAAWIGVSDHTLELGDESWVNTSALYVAQGNKRALPLTPDPHQTRSTWINPRTETNWGCVEVKCRWGRS